LSLSRKSFDPMTCGMLLRDWIEWGVDIITPAYVIKQG